MAIIFGKGALMKGHKLFRAIFLSSIALTALLLFLAFVVPFFSYANGSSTSKSYLFTIISTGLSLSGSSTATSINFFYGVMIIILAFLGLFFLTVEKKTNWHIFGISFSFSIAIFAFYLHGILNEAFKGTTVSINRGGDVLFLIYGIFALILCAVVLVEDLFGEAIAKLFANAGKKSKEERLVELKSLLDKQLISQAEYDEQRKAIIDEK